MRTTAWYWVETHEATFPFALPQGAVLESVRLGGEPVRQQVERSDKGDHYRVVFPVKTGNAPAMMEISYHFPLDRKAGIWIPPRLLEGGIVQQTLWDVRLPWSRAVVGTPAGWTDENEWYWDRYLWKRRPTRAPGALIDWVAATPARSRSSSDQDRCQRLSQLPVRASL